jgi:hypothetical protein
MRPSEQKKLEKRYYYFLLGPVFYIAPIVHFQLCSYHHESCSVEIGDGNVDTKHVVDVPFEYYSSAAKAESTTHLAPVRW